MDENLEINMLMKNFTDSGVDADSIALAKKDLEEGMETGKVSCYMNTKLNYSQRLILANAFRGGMPLELGQLILSRSEKQIGEIIPHLSERIPYDALSDIISKNTSLKHLEAAFRKFNEYLKRFMTEDAGEQKKKDTKTENPISTPAPVVAPAQTASEQAQDENTTTSPMETKSESPNLPDGYVPITAEPAMSNPIPAPLYPEAKPGVTRDEMEFLIQKAVWEVRKNDPPMGPAPVPVPSPAPAPDPNPAMMENMFKLMEDANQRNFQMFEKMMQASDERSRNMFESIRRDQESLRDEAKQLKDEAEKLKEEASKATQASIAPAQAAPSTVFPQTPTLSLLTPAPTPAPVYVPATTPTKDTPPAREPAPDTITTVKEAPRKESQEHQKPFILPAGVDGSFRFLLLPDGSTCPVFVEQTKSSRPRGILGLASRIFGKESVQTSLLTQLIDGKLTSEQLKAIHQAVKNNLRPEDIKQLINSHLGANEMMSIVDVVTAQREQFQGVM